MFNWVDTTLYDDGCSYLLKVFDSFALFVDQLSMFWGDGDILSNLCQQFWTSLSHNDNGTSISEGGTQATNHHMMGNNMMIKPLKLTYYLEMYAPIVGSLYQS